MQVASHVSLHTRDLHSLTLFSPKGPFGSLLVAWGWEHFVASLIPSSWLNCGGWVGTRHCSVPTMAWFERGWHAGDLQSSMTVTSPKKKGPTLSRNQGSGGENAQRSDVSVLARRERMTARL